MAIVVQKYGGSLIDDINSLHKIADSVIDCKNRGNSVVVVVSAKIGMTDSLLNLAKAANPNAEGYLLDLLLSIGEQSSSALLGLILEQRGVSVDVKTGARIGIYSDANNDLHVNVSEFNSSLKDGNIIIVSGFQALSDGNHIVTLGRGGSDLTAVVLAHYLNADSCDIYKTIDGVLRISPKIFPNDEKIKKMSHRDAFIIASSGAKIIQAKAADFAYLYKVPFNVVSMNVNSSGTVINTSSSNFLNENFWVALNKSANVYEFEKIDKNAIQNIVNTLKKQYCHTELIDYSGKVYVSIDNTDGCYVRMLENAISDFCKSMEKLEKFTIIGKKRPDLSYFKKSYKLIKKTNMFTSAWIV